jgi:hypothetical protein
MYCWLEDAAEGVELAELVKRHRAPPSSAKQPIVISNEEEDAELSRQAEMLRMSCGKCDNCKVERVRLYPYQGVWDVCEKCLALTTSQKAKKTIKPKTKK